MMGDWTYDDNDGYDQIDDGGHVQIKYDKTVPGDKRCLEILVADPQHHGYKCSGPMKGYVSGRGLEALTEYLMPMFAAQLVPRDMLIGHMLIAMIQAYCPKGNRQEFVNRFFAEVLTPVFLDANRVPGRLWVEQNAGDKEFAVCFHFRGPGEFSHLTNYWFRTDYTSGWDVSTTMGGAEGTYETWGMAVEAILGNG